MVPSLFGRFVRLLRPQQGIVDEHKQQLLRLLPVRLHLHSNLHPPIEKSASSFICLAMASEDIQNGHTGIKSPPHS